ncbi:MAG: response regulator transcription factor [Candidatus Niameybacter stercoravium]|nr:response regulator transcription factor [Candidatus Niameybacter stercoravium]
MKKILIVDDEQDIRQILTILLTGEGYEVVCACDAEEAITRVDETIALIVLDVNMPGKSGFVACSEIRQRWQTPILFLTAYGQESDKAMGFCAGGDDYITKPFSNTELLLRVKALLRRCYIYQPVPIKDSLTLSVGDLCLDEERQKVTVEGVEVILTSTEYNILHLLLRHRKKVFSMENIYNSIWEEGTAVGDNAVMVHIKNLRKKIEKDTRHPRYIKTAWGKGYYID